MLVFGNQTHFATFELMPRKSPLGSCVYYTHPSFDAFYSIYGLAIPLDFNAKLFDDMLEFPKIDMPENAKYDVSVYAYFRISSDRRVTLPLVTLMEDSSIILSTRSIYPQKQGWWLVEPTETDEDPDKQTLIGFLHTDPTKDEIDAYISTYFNTRKLQWFVIDDVVEKIQTIQEEYDRSKASNSGEDVVTIPNQYTGRFYESLHKEELKTEAEEDVLKIID